jgi:uncharacterized membrane protein (DUF4010 family)
MAALDIDLFERLALSLAIGVLIGVERGWQERDAKPGSRAAGIRTFALIGLLGGVWGLLARIVGPAVLGFAALGFSAGLTLFEWRETRAAGGFSATGLVAGLLAFALGAYAVLGNAIAAASAAVAATFILAERKALHAFLDRMSWEELRAALLLLVMTFIALPLLPDRAIDPWGAVNPHQIWLMTIVIAALSYAGYVAVRLAGGRNGLLYAGTAGGLVSSTTVTWTFARLANESPHARLLFLAGIAGSWSASLLRVIVVALVLAPPFGILLAKVVGGALIFLVLCTATVFWLAGRDGEAAPLVLKDPFELSVILRFALILTAVMLAAKLAAQAFGQGGVLSLAALAGSADVDPILLSMSQGVSRGGNPDAAALAVLVAVATNTLAKTSLGFFFGRWAVGGALLGLSAGAISLGAIGYWLFG